MKGRCVARRLAFWLLIVGALVAARGQDAASAKANFSRASAASRTAAPVTPDRVLHEPAFPRPFPLPPGTFGFPQIARAAGIIFSGTVTSTSRVLASGGEDPQAVAVTFHVERGIRGASAGRDLTIFQWIGLWASGQRYRVGERVLLFLYAPSKLGLTSCVGGTMGRFRIDPLGNVVLTDEHLAAFGADPVLGGKSRVSMRDFTQAVRRARGEE